MTVWQYWVETINTEYEIDAEQNIDNSPGGDRILQGRLDQMGQDGWELVSFLPAFPAGHFKGIPPNPWVFHAVFKRPAE